MRLHSDEDGNRHRHRHGREGSGAAPTALERRIEELERELAAERQENNRLLKAHQDKDELINKLKEEIDLLNRVRSGLVTPVVSFFHFPLGN
ncbi:PRKC apoptosis WT1 regulator protein [Labeo rohita]|uniref:PRKC apoptosis WT1 regulator protein n=1 Tax=Labeo rohita TaxID=84645 RepID=A0ABQ8MR89_LABRO|nr:PRKC apoptosis WT1 regulator protein [Labeo rohita]